VFQYNKYIINLNEIHWYQCALLDEILNLGFNSVFTKVKSLFPTFPPVQLRPGSTTSQFREDFVVSRHNVEGGRSILLQVGTCLWQGPKFWVQPSVIFEAVWHRGRKKLQRLTKFFLSVDYNPTRMKPALEWPRMWRITKVSLWEEIYQKHLVS
jgi:hypothetical protein